MQFITIPLLPLLPLFHLAEGLNIPPQRFPPPHLPPFPPASAPQMIIIPCDPGVCMQDCLDHDRMYGFCSKQSGSCVCMDNIYAEDVSTPTESMNLPTLAAVPISFPTKAVESFAEAIELCAEAIVRAVPATSPLHDGKKHRKNGRKEKHGKEGEKDKLETCKDDDSEDMEKERKWWILSDKDMNKACEHYGKRTWCIKNNKDETCNDDEDMSTEAKGTESQVTNHKDAGYLDECEDMNKERKWWLLTDNTNDDNKNKDKHHGNNDNNHQDGKKKKHHGKNDEDQCYEKSCDKKCDKKFPGSEGVCNIFGDCVCWDTSFTGGRKEKEPVCHEKNCDRECDKKLGYGGLCNIWGECVCWDARFVKGRLEL